MRHLYATILLFTTLLAGIAFPAQAESGHGAFSVGYAQVHPGGVPALSGTGARAGDLKGINVKYRYEFTDHLGGIVALSYASVKKSDTMKTGENTFHYESLRGRYVSLMAGPVWQLSERVSLYGMAGMAYTRWSDSVQDYRRDEVKPGYVKETTTASDGHTARHLSPAWNAGIQFSPVETVVIDLAYEGSASGDWRTDGFIVGVGYKVLISQVTQCYDSPPVQAGFFCGVNMAVKISGVLKDGTGKPVENCTIQLKARRTSSTVVVNTVASENPDEAGRYSMDVEYGQYSVILLVEGFPPSHAGTITVYEDSQPGTLNDFLGAMSEDDVPAGGTAPF